MRGHLWIMNSPQNHTKSNRNGLTAFVKSKTDELVCRYVREEKRSGKTLQAIADEFGPTIHYGDIARAIKNILPRDNHKRRDFGLSPLVTISTDVETPQGVKIPANAKFLICPTCGDRFVRTANNMKFCNPGCRKR